MIFSCDELNSNGKFMFEHLQYTVEMESQVTDS